MVYLIHPMGRSDWWVAADKKYEVAVGEVRRNYSTCFAEENAMRFETEEAARAFINTMNDSVDRLCAYIVTRNK